MTERNGQDQVLIVAGEASGDLHAANLIRAARDISPGLHFFGIAGPRMRDAGCETLSALENLAVMGVTEVLSKLPAIKRVFNRLRGVLRGSKKPDLLVLVDYPGFNLRLAREAKRAGVPVLYYISPKIWASRPGRIRSLARWVDRLALIFPFEVDLFRGSGVSATYVGNPLLDEFQPPRERGEYLLSQGLDPQRPVVGIFPGSRRGEISHIFPTLLETAAKLAEERPALQFLLPLAPSLDRDLVVGPIRERGLAVRLPEEGSIYDIAAACDVVLSVSGTVTLQIALTETPMVVLYKVSSLTYFLAKHLVRTPFIGLPNIVAGRQVVPELIQQAANQDALAREVLRILDDREYRSSILTGLREVRQKLGREGCSRRVAGIIQDMLANKPEDSLS